MSEHIKSRSQDPCQDHELVVPQQLIKYKPTTLFDNLSTEISQDHELVSQRKQFKKSILFDNLSPESRKQIEYPEDQCQGKYNYLLLCYKKKLDNRHKTGSAVYEFEFFNELDELFGRKPNIRPMHLASSSCIYNGIKENDGISNKDNMSSSKCTSNTTPPEEKKQKKIEVSTKQQFKKDAKKKWPCLNLHLKHIKHIILISYWKNCDPRFIIL